MWIQSENILQPMVMGIRLSVSLLWFFFSHVWVFILRARRILHALTMALIYSANSRTSGFAVILVTRQSHVQKPAPDPSL
jgi:hypothetical protein